MSNGLEGRTLHQLSMFYPGFIVQKEHEQLIKDAIAFFRVVSKAPPGTTAPAPGRGNDRADRTLSVKPSHYQYGGSSTWYSEGVDFFVHHPSAVKQLFQYIASFYSLGAPLCLIESLEDKYRMFLDLDIKIPAAADFQQIEATLLDAPNGYRFFGLLLSEIGKFFPSTKERRLALFTASGEGKVSFRVVFPDVIVDGKTSTQVRHGLVSALCNASFKESTEIWARELSQGLLALDPLNEWRNVLDESSLSGRMGVRAVLCDKLHATTGCPEGRPMRPLGVLAQGMSGTSMVVAATHEVSSLVAFVELGSLKVAHTMALTPFTAGAELRRTRMTRTGPGGSCCDVEFFQTSLMQSPAGAPKPSPNAPVQFVTLDARFPGTLESFRSQFVAATGRWNQNSTEHAVWNLSSKVTLEFKQGRVHVKALTERVLTVIKQLLSRVKGLEITAGSRPPSSAPSVGAPARPSVSLTPAPHHQQSQRPTARSL